MGVPQNSNNKDIDKPNFVTKDSSEIKVCRPDPYNSRFMICNWKTKRIENINGEDIVKFDEKEERVPIMNTKQQDIFSTKTKDEAKSMASNFIDNLFTFGQEAQNLESDFKKGLDNLNKKSFGLFGEFFKEVDQTFNTFQKAGQQFESFINKDFGNLFDDKTSNTREGDAFLSKEDTEQSFSKGYENKKSDQETYDV